MNKKDKAIVKKKIAIIFKITLFVLLSILIMVLRYNLKYGK